MSSGQKKTDAAAVSNIDPDLKFRVTESYKAVRTNIMFSLIKKECKTVVITSSLPGEGKSTVAVNLAISLAQTDFRVLLVDTDLRKPKVNRFLNLPNVPGLTNLLGGMNTVQEVLHSTKYPNLQVICAGVTVPNPSEMLASEQMTEFVASVQGQYDYVIFDSTPINLVSDGLPLAKNSDGVILVVRDRRSNHKDLEKTIKSLELIDAKILGFVLNGVETAKRHRYRYGYGYGYGYGPKS